MTELDQALSKFKAEKDKKYTKVVNAVEHLIIEACEQAENGDWEAEWRRLYRAEVWAKQAVFRGGLDMYQELKEELRKQGLILRGSDRIGYLESEERLAYSGRSGIPIGQLSAHPETLPAHFYSDRVCQGDTVSRLSKDTSVSLTVDGQEMLQVTKTGSAGIGINPLPGLGFGLASSTVVSERKDTRICQLALVDIGWHMQVMFHPRFISDARLMAQRIQLYVS